MLSFEEFCSLNEEKWSADVDTKVKAPEGLFTKDAQEIADWLIGAHKDLKGAMSSLDFYMNRAGEKLSDERKEALEKAKEIVHKHFA